MHPKYIFIEIYKYEFTIRLIIFILRNYKILNTYVTNKYLNKIKYTYENV